MATKPPLPPRGEDDDPEIVLPNANAGDTVARHRQHTNYLSPLHALAQATQKRPISPSDLSVLQDSRNSSTQSLGNGESPSLGRKTLLIVYIHGFVGDETSFQSFPAHVHNVLVSALSETHVIYSKVYPRYKTRREMTIARDDFSNWLIPHESDTTDVILVGHSLGGILAAEVILMQNPESSSKDYFKHRILGLVAFDTPFLGMHPGIIKSGLASLFRPKSNEVGITTSTQLPDSGVSSPLSQVPSTNSTTNTSIMSLLSPGSDDPNFNPSYPNDIKLRTHTGNFERAMYFWNKHCGELFKASQSYFQSYVDFGGCLADFPGLQKRYAAVKALEALDSSKSERVRNGQYIHRLRFVNYYTASSGRIHRSRRQSPAPSVGSNRERNPSAHSEQFTDQPPMRSLSPRPASEDLEPRASVESSGAGKELGEHLHVSGLTLDGVREQQGYDGGHEEQLPSYTPTDGIATEVEPSLRDSMPITDDLPPIPPAPAPPAPLDESKWSSKDALKLAQQEHKRQTKAFEQAKKDRSKAIKAREKAVAKRLKESQKRAAKMAKAEVQKQNDAGKQELKRLATMETPTPAQQPKDRKFCMLPTRDPKTGVRDPTWVRIYMEGLDEVEAHQNMFSPRETYEELVVDVATRIRAWVEEEVNPRTYGLPMAEPVD